MSDEERFIELNPSEGTFTMDGKTYRYNETPGAEGDQAIEADLADLIAGLTRRELVYHVNRLRLIEMVKGSRAANAELRRLVEETRS